MFFPQNRKPRNIQILFLKAKRIIGCKPTLCPLTGNYPPDKNNLTFEFPNVFAFPGRTPPRSRRSNRKGRRG